MLQSTVNFFTGIYKMKNPAKFRVFPEIIITWYEMYIVCIIRLSYRVYSSSSGPYCGVTKYITFWYITKTCTPELDITRMQGNYLWYVTRHGILLDLGTLQSTVSMNILDTRFINDTKSWYVTFCVRHTL